MNTMKAPDDGSRGVAMQRRLQILYRNYLDASVPHRSLRWSIFGFLCFLYLIRVLSYGGFYVITYALGIHMLYLLLMLVTPLSDPEELATDEAQLPTREADGEFKPFVPKVQEFVVWKSMMKVLLVCLVLVMFPFLDIPVYWPILLIYFVVLCITQMGGRIKHMVRYKYVPWNAGKPKYVPKKSNV
ncbi:unnamed protein product [Phytomonas sp. EM1]|nr:unnamed protein product [Phytomonas sp. EM1]|eukprot:CCW65553.1 unnamed protein product [Phytomonas sp. isolate EM1]